MADEHMIELTPEINEEGVLKSAKRLRNAIQSIFDGTEGKQLDSRLQSIQMRMADVAKKSDELTAKIEQLGNAKVPTDAYKDLNDAILETRKRLSQLKEAQEKADTYGGRRAKSSASYRQRADEIERLTQELQQQEQLRRQMVSEGVAYMSGSETEEYQRLISQQEVLNNRMRIYTESWNEAVARQDQMIGSGAIREQRQEITDTNRAMMGLTSTLRGITRLLPGVSARGVMATSMLIRGVTRLSTLTRQDLVAALGVVKKAFLKLFAAIAAHPIIALIVAVIAALFALIKAIKKSIEQIKKELDTIYKALSKIAKKALKAISQSVLNLVKSSALLYKTIAKKLASLVSSLISRLKSLQSTVTEGLKTLAQWNNGLNGTNEALSNLTSSLDYVKLALATAFAPIVEVIEPMLTRLMDLLAEVITLIGMFVAKLTGATTFKRAIRQQKDYAKSLEGVGKAAEDAEQKLASYDKLQVISKDSSSGGGSDVSGMLEEVSLKDFELPEWLKDLYSLGVTVGTKLRDVLNSIPWEKIQKGASKAAKGIADFINGMMSVVGLGQSVGRTLAGIVNTATTFITGLLTKIDFKQIGKQIRGMLDSFLELTNFRQLGEILSDSINALMNMLIGIFSDPGLGKRAGQSLTEFLRGALEGINWNNVSEALKGVTTTLADLLNTLINPDNFKLIFTSLGNLTNSIVESIRNLSDQSNWTQFGDSVAEGINSFFSTVDWEYAGETISNLAHNLLDMLLKAINKVDWDKVSDSLIDFISNIDWKGIAKKAVEISQKLREGLQKIWEELADSDAFDDIIGMIVDFLKEKKNWEKAFKRIKSEVIRRVFVEKVIESLKDFFRVEEFMDVFRGAQECFEEGGVKIIEGIGLGIFGALDMVFGWATSIFESLWNGICNVFGIHSPADTMKPIGENIVNGILEGFGLVDFGAKMSEWWNNNVAPWFTLEKWSSIGQNMVTGLSNKVEELKTKLADKWTSIKETAVNAFNTIKEKIAIPVNGILSIVESLINKIIDGINGLTSKLNSVGFDVKNPFNGEVYSLGFNIPQINRLSIPRLAQGAVIPPNKEFAAILGDQKSGTNIETPLSTMVEAFKQAMSEMGGTNQPIVLQLNGRTVAQAVWDEEAKRYKQVGRYKTL